MPDEKTQALADAYVLGALEPAEAAEFSRRLAEGEASAAEALAQAQQVVAALAFALPAQPTPPGLKQRVLQAAAAAGSDLPAAGTGAITRSLPVRRISATAMRTLALAAGFLVVALGAASWLLQRQALQALRGETASLRQQIQQKEAELAQLKLALALHHDLARALHQSRVMLVTLNSPQPNQPGKATVLLNREEQRAYFVALDLPPLSEEYDYQLWYIGNSGPVGGGVFDVDEAGYAVLEVRNLPAAGVAVSAFAVTREPRGGSATPTLTQMLLFGKV